MDRFAGVTVFEPETHTYRRAGRIVPHVTGILAPLMDFSMVSPQRLETARQKGTAVHRLVELCAKGVECELPDWMQSVSVYWQQFIRDTGFRMITSEQVVYHPTFDYAGTLDLVCELPNTRLKGPGVLDVKRSFIGGAVIGYQTAA